MIAFSLYVEKVLPRYFHLRAINGAAEEKRSVA